MSSISARPLVVCVDDDMLVLLALQRLLRREPYEFLVTDSPRESLQWVEFRKVDVLISDYMMPEMKGTDLLKAVRERSPDTARVLMTGAADIRVIGVAVREAQIHRLICKPWDEEEFRKMILGLLQPLEAHL